MGNCGPCCITWAHTRAVKLVFDCHNVNSSAAQQANHSAQAGHEVAAPACASLGKIHLLKTAISRVKEGGDVQTPASRYDFAFLVD